LSGSAIFKAENRSVHLRILENTPTTTNVCEAWNKGINFSIRTPHPLLNDLLKELRTRDYLITNKLNAGLINPKDKKTKKKK
jgi:hypothetical protein